YFVYTDRVNMLIGFVEKTTHFSSQGKGTARNETVPCRCSYLWKNAQWQPSKSKTDCDDAGNDKLNHPASGRQIICHFQGNHFHSNNDPSSGSPFDDHFR